MILLIIGIILHSLLFITRNDIPLTLSILYNYSNIDIRFLISLLFNIYYITILYKCIFQYLDLDIEIKTRLTKKQLILFYIKRTLIFTIIYIIIQTIIMILIQQYPILDILKNIVYYYICIIIAMITLYKKDYIYVILLTTITILKLL